ncbi:hypothetical protein LXA43DRAFT_58863 [Ganoderma leucocontextum]|nr:hypothetical protein LXA43DRAFT_58863 [Ganoderma leucocontextum]
MDQFINEAVPKPFQDLLTALVVELPLTSVSTLRLVDDALSTVRTAVRTHLNLCAPVNRLPPEVLFAIFDIVRCGFPHCDGVDVGDHAAILRPDNNSLIAATHVCRRWRDIAVGYAHLWTSVSTSSPSAPTFFERSRGLPLKVFVALTQGKPPSIPKHKFLNQFPRIKALHIDLECSWQIRHWKKHLQSLARSLESLTVVTCGPQTLLEANLSMPLGEAFFGAECPVSLKFLSISGTTALLPTDHFPILEYAHVSAFQAPPGRPFRLEWPADLLLNTPRLRTFHLHLQSTQEGFLAERYYPTQRRIALPMMRHLCITLPQIPTYLRARSTGSGALAAARAMVSTLDMPPTTVVSIRQGSSCSESSSDTQAGAMPGHLY